MTDVCLPAKAFPVGNLIVKIRADTDHCTSRVVPGLCRPQSAKPIPERDSFLSSHKVLWGHLYPKADKGAGERENDRGGEREKEGERKPLLGMLMWDNRLPFLLSLLMLSLHEANSTRAQVYKGWNEALQRIQTPRRGGLHGSLNTRRNL